MAQISIRKKRVKTGCVTCRIRRVKCDEGQPFCQNCVSSDRTCGGYSSLPFTRRELAAASSIALDQDGGRVVPVLLGHEVLPRLTTDPAFNDVLEKRYFQFFRHHIASGVQSIWNSPFWGRVVLQASHAEPAVKYVVLAISSLVRSMTMSQSEDVRLEHFEFASKTYHRALREARELITKSTQQDVDKVLIACVVFSAFDAVAGNYDASLRHMQCGRAITAQRQPPVNPLTRRHEMREIEQTLFRMDISALSFQDNSTEIRLRVDDFHKTNPNLYVSDFKTLAEARTNLFELVRWQMVTTDALHDPDFKDDPVWSQRLVRDLAKLAARLREWRIRLDELAETLDAASRVGLATLQIWHATSTIGGELGFISRESSYDLHARLFDMFVSLGEEIAPQASEAGGFCLEVGYIIPMFFAAVRCRDPAIRRRAVAVMRDYPRQEGAWHSTAAAVVAQKVVEHEELGLGEVRSVHDVPEENRVHRIKVTVSVSKGSAIVMLYTFGALQRGTGGAEYKVTW